MKKYHIGKQNTNGGYSVLPVLAPCEAIPGLPFIAARIPKERICSSARWLLPAHFPDHQYPPEINGLMRQARRRGQHAYCLAWPDDTAALIFLSQSQQNPPSRMAQSAYHAARQVREQLLLERLSP